MASPPPFPCARNTVRAAGPVIDPHMPVNEFIHGSPKEWNVEILENLVDQEDMPLIQSFVISQSNRDDK